MSNKNKVIITVLAILGAVVLMVVMFNKMNMAKKVEKFVDDESETDDIEGYEELEAGADVDAEEAFAEGDEEEEPASKTKDKKDTKEMKEDKEEKKASAASKEDKDAASKPSSKDKDDTQSTVATKLKQFIDTLDKEINSKDVSNDIKSKIMKELMQNVSSLQEMGLSASKVVSDAVNKYAPPKSTYVDAPVVSRSMDTVKGHLRAALNELESISATEAFNERFTPSRPAPTSAKKVEPMMVDDAQKGTIEGFENAPRYALY